MDRRNYSVLVYFPFTNPGDTFKPSRAYPLSIVLVGQARAREFAENFVKSHGLMVKIISRDHEEWFRPDEWPVVPLKWPEIDLESLPVPGG